MAESERGSGGGLPNELHGEQSSLEALRAKQLSAEPGHEHPGKVGKPADGVLTQVCMQCGKQYIYDKEPPPEDLTCEKCGSKVFRPFFTDIAENEAAADFRDTTERDLATDDDPGDVTRGDIADLNNL